MGSPNHQFYFGIFHEINHPYILGVPPMTMEIPNWEWIIQPICGDLGDGLLIIVLLTLQ